MELRSASFPAESTIPIKHAEPGVGGQNVSPELSWTPGPAASEPGDVATLSYMITCFDPDAPTGSGWWHWIVTDIPASVTSIPEGGPLPEGARTWNNDYGYPGWGGPWPPPGPAHHYVFTVYALQVERLDVPDDASDASARLAAGFACLDKAEFTALFKS
jgi:Raf kinase inhibitor-like YbhB/YbcL family protein